jgi:predicted RND superfamily exporter protein
MGDWDTRTVTLPDKNAPFVTAKFGRFVSTYFDQDLAGFEFPAAERAQIRSALEDFMHGRISLKEMDDQLKTIGGEKLKKLINSAASDRVFAASNSKRTRAIDTIVTTRETFETRVRSLVPLVATYKQWQRDPDAAHYTALASALINFRIDLRNFGLSETSARELSSVLEETVRGYPEVIAPPETPQAQTFPRIVPPPSSRYTR